MVTETLLLVWLVTVAATHYNSEDTCCLLYLLTIVLDKDLGKNPFGGKSIPDYY